MRKVTDMKITLSALITWGELRRIMLKIFTGNVVLPGPDTRKVMTKSSMERVKANNPPAAKPGPRSGSQIRQMIVPQFAPRSWAASIMDSSKSCNRPNMTNVT